MDATGALATFSLLQPLWSGLFRTLIVIPLGSSSTTLTLTESIFGFIPSITVVLVNWENYFQFFEKETELKLKSVIILF